jgi:2-polyprenyl-3-methyl-5-hydroxy-6-metoxy-1,4-benzoquinol methylase
MSKEWIDLQQRKYAGANFGETDNVVTKNLAAYKSLLEIAKPGMTFLDIGCNNGRICFEMKKLGLKELGVDLPQVIQKCKLDFNKQALDLESEFPAGTYDLIFCREVIEHIQRYEQVFQLIFEALNEEGTAIITAPFDKKDFGKNCPEHVRLFSEAELKQHIKKAGGKVLNTFREKVCRSIGCVCEKADV